MSADSTSKAIRDTFTSPNVADANLEPANLVDVVHYVARAADRIATAITPRAAPGKDANGGHVESLTEAVMGMTVGLNAIADAINHLAEAVENRGRP